MNSLMLRKSDKSCLILVLPSGLHLRQQLLSDFMALKNSLQLFLQLNLMSRCVTDGSLPYNNVTRRVKSKDFSVFFVEKVRVQYRFSKTGALNFLNLGFFNFTKLSTSYVINVFLMIYQLGTCCVYVVFVASNIKGIVDLYFDEVDVRLIMLVILLPLIFINWVSCCMICLTQFIRRIFRYAKSPCWARV